MSFFSLFDNALRPRCSVCQDQELFRDDKLLELQKLKQVGEYKSYYDHYTHLCEKCWKKISNLPCDLCHREFNVVDNRFLSLTENLKYHGIILSEMKNVKRVCKSCSDERYQSTCHRCQKSFHDINPDYFYDKCVDIQKLLSGKKLNSDFDKTKFEQSLLNLGETSHPNYQVNVADLCLQWLKPYHKNYIPGIHDLNWKDNSITRYNIQACLCPACIQACVNSCIDVESRLKNFIGCTRDENLRQYKTIKEFGRVEYKGKEFDDPGKVEELLRLYAAQKGGNALVLYFWKKQESRFQNRVIAGYGPKGNPYYKTEITVERWFTGYATAVLVDSLKNDRSSPKETAPGPINKNLKHVVLDGVNICRWASQEKNEIDLRIVLTLCNELYRQLIPILVFFDANMPYMLRERNDEAAFNAYKALTSRLPSVFIEVPGKISADEFILLRARNENSHIISNDQFRDFFERHPWIVGNKRLIKGTAAGNRLTIPQLDIDIRIISDARGTADELIKKMTGQ